MKKFMTYARNHKGVTLVMMALMLALLIMFASLAIDISYMYYAKNQLQVAADASALAGAAKIVDFSVDPTPTQIEARQAAWQFACKNKAAGLSNISGSVNFSHNNVYLANNSDDGSCNVAPAVSQLNPGNDASGDIVLGNWNSNRSPIDCRFLPSSNASCPALSSGINAVKVVANRTRTDAVDNIKSGNNPANVFLGKIFNIIGTDWSLMSTSARAIAARPPRATAYFDVCWQENINDGACKDDAGIYCSTSNPCSVANGRLTAPRNLCFQSSTPNMQSMGWTSLTNPPCSQNNIDNTLLCAEQPNESVCGEQICVQNGGTSSPKLLGSLMYDPLYDSENKTCLTANGKCQSSSDIVTGWWVIVPVTATCPAGTGGSSNAVPKDVYGYARLHINTVCWSGGGQGCGGNNPHAPASCTNFCGNNYVQIDAITCVDCPNMDQMLGPKAVLVQ